MTSSAFIAHVLDPLIEPRFAEQDAQLEKIFVKSDDQVTREALRGLKRSHVYSIDWAGDKLLTAAQGHGLRLYDVEKGVEERTWAGEWMSMSCDPNNSSHVAAAVSWNGKFLVFDLRASGTQVVYDVDLKKTSSAMKEFLSLCWSPDSRNIAISNRGDQVYLLDIRGSLRLGASKNIPHEVNSMLWSPQGDSLWIATGGTPGRIQIFPAPSLQNEGGASILAHQHATVCLAADTAGQRIASGGGDCLVTLWDPNHLVCVGTFGHATQAVTSLGFNHTGNLLAWGTGGSGSSGGEKNLTVVGADTRNLYWQESTMAPVQLVKWHHTKNILAYALNSSQLPEGERDVRDRRIAGRDVAVMHLLKIPEFR